MAKNPYEDELAAKRRDEEIRTQQLTARLSDAAPMGQINHYIEAWDRIHGKGGAGVGGGAGKGGLQGFQPLGMAKDKTAEDQQTAAFVSKYGMAPSEVTRGIGMQDWAKRGPNDIQMTPEQTRIQGAYQSIRDRAGNAEAARLKALAGQDTLRTAQANYYDKGAKGGAGSSHNYMADTLQKRIQSYETMLANRAELTPEQLRDYNETKDKFRQLAGIESQRPAPVAANPPEQIPGRSLGDWIPGIEGQQEKYVREHNAGAGPAPANKPGPSYTVNNITVPAKSRPAYTPSGQSKDMTPLDNNMNPIQNSRSGKAVKFNHTTKRWEYAE